MAVNIDTVYQKVLATANKEQRGYITPQEFNLYADQAQMDIFERYFHDIRQAETRMETNTEFSSSLDMLEEKLSVFRVNDQVVYPDSHDGTITLPEDLHRLGSIVYCKREQGGYGKYLNIEVEEIDKKDIGYLLNTIHTTPTARRPAFIRLTNNKIKIYPSHPEVYGSDTLISYDGPAQFFNLLGTLSFSNGSTSATYTDSNNEGLIMQYYLDSGHMPSIVDGSKNTNSYSVTSSNVYLSPDTLIVAPFPTSTGVLTLSKPAIQTGTTTVFIAVGNVKCNYIKKPLTPSWSYVEINGAALHNPGSSIDFQLHASEESALVARVLQLAGITLKDNNLLQIASAEEGKIIQNQKQ